MRVKVVTVLILALAISTTFAQKKKGKNDKTEQAPAATTSAAPAATAPAKTDSVPRLNPLIQHYASKYSAAIQWNDYDVAKDALYDLIVENPGNDSLIFDLAIFYYQNQKYPSAVLVSKELLSRNPKNISALEISAVGYENLGALEGSLQSYESLYLLTNNSATLYKMAFLQYQLKRYKEASTSADILLASKDADTLKVTFNDAQNKQKEYLMKVAVINLKGQLAEDQGDKVNARKFYTQALAIAPDFTPAKENLAKLK